MNQETLIILKPDCMSAGQCGAVISRFEAEGFKIVASSVQTLSSDLLKEHYAHVAHLPFFPDIEAFMSSCPVLILLLEGDSVIARVRELLGPTNSEEAPKGTIRGDLGTDRMHNMVHASDSPENALIEKKRFFPNL